MNDNCLPCAPSYSNAFSIASDIQDMVRLQGFIFGYFNKTVCHTILGQPLPQRGQKVDQRKQKIPEALQELLKVLLRMFEVNPETYRRRYYSEKFEDGIWRLTSYAEFKRVRAGTTFTEWCLKSALRKLEAYGIIERRREFIPSENRTALWLKFNARKLLDILDAHPKQRREKGQKVEVACGQDTPENSEETSSEHLSDNEEYLPKPEENEKLPTEVNIPILLKSTPADSLAADGSAAAGVIGTKKDSSVLAPPTRDAIFVKNKEVVAISPEAAAVWQELLAVFPAKQLNLKTAKMLERRVRNPVPEQRLTVADANRYCVCHAGQRPEDWVFNLTLLKFLRMWPSVKTYLSAAAVFFNDNNAQVFLRQMEDFFLKFNSECVYHGRRVWDIFYSPGNVAKSMEEVIFQIYPCDDYAAVLASHICGLDVAAVLVERRKGFREWAEKCPTVCVEMNEYVPTRQWAGFNSAEWSVMINRAEKEYQLACHYWEEGRRAGCPLLENVIC